ncbi:MAG TPA: SAM-dependent methyltransferase [Rhodanobacteraceae bacterium]|nr:SAM-dependent methyltransferase [Rhodanobacteraceae bacterium]
MSASLPEPDADERAHSQRLVAALQAEIAAQGPIPFSRYMERCLYAPGLGYYSAGRSKFGASGDFVTAPELGTLFAECVVQALLPTLRELGGGAEIVELGGGSGAFAEAALKRLDTLGTLPKRYGILEPSADLQQRQQQRLVANLTPALLARVHWLQRPPEDDWQGVLFANEVIDALPATRFTKRGGEVFEEHVALADGTLQRRDLPADALVGAAVRHLERDLGTEFADGYRSELLPQLPYWMQAVAGSLSRGLLLFVDYGYPRHEYYLPERTDGTLIAHYRHRAHGDAMHLPGLQDLSTSVDFTALAEAGNQAGFAVAAYVPQAAFLIAAGLEPAFQRTHEAAADEAERYALAQQVKRLTLPGQMGERFQAMLLVRDLPPQALDAAVLGVDQSRRL